MHLDHRLRAACYAIITALFGVVVMQDIHGQRVLEVSNVSAEQDKYFSNLQDIEEDQFGFLWLATGEGLIRYDGYAFMTFSHDIDDSNTMEPELSPLRSTRIDAFHLDRRGNFYCSTTGGLYLFFAET